MAEINASLVKTLRERTGQSMMECKKALTEAHGDLEAAVDILKKKGLADATRKAARTTQEGLIAIQPEKATIVEVVCETDFCARNEEFRKLVREVARLAGESRASGDIPASDAVTAAVQACFRKIGENMRYSRGYKLRPAPRVGGYIHHNGKVGVLVGVEGELSDQTLSDLCMHIAFADPLAIRPEEIAPALVERERRVAGEQAAESGKPPAVQEKIVQGKVNKFLAANALLEQPFVKDDKKKVKEILGPAKITEFVRFAIGQ